MWTDDPRSRVVIGGVQVVRMTHPDLAQGAHRVDYPTRTVFVWPDHHSALYHARLIRNVLKDCQAAEHLIGRLVMEGCEIEASSGNRNEANGN